jgi:hypothetical protein
VSVVELTPEEREQINDGVGLLLKKGQQIVAVEFDASDVAGGHGLGLMRGLLEHGGQTEVLSRAGLMQDNFLVVFVDGSDAGASGDDDIGGAGGIADLENALARWEPLDFNLRSENAKLVIVEVGKQRHITQDCRITRHRKSPRVKMQEV